MSTSIPARHPDHPGPVPAAIALAAAALRIGKPDAGQWTRLGDQLSIGDDPMDSLVASAPPGGLKKLRTEFERALADGVASVPDAPKPLQDFFASIETPPDWVDPEALRVGQQVLRRGGADGMYIARDVALLGGYQFSGFNQTLLRTGALEKGSNQRFAETMRWGLDVIGEGSLDPFGAGYRSTVHVRFVHAMVRRHVGALPDWRPDRWGVPINQTDMAATLIGTLVVPPLGALGMGVLATPRELNCVAHLTRYVGWLMGVRDEWLPRSFRDAIRILYHTSTALALPDETTRMLSTPMAADPLSWHYRRARRLRRRLAWAQHLSVTTAFLGPRTMRALGLPTYMPPWYPMIRIPVNGARSLAAWTLPGGARRAADRGLREQESFLRTIIGDTEAIIGASVTHVHEVPEPADPR